MSIRGLACALLFAAPFVVRAQGPRPQVDQVALDQEIRTRVTRLLKDQVGLTDAQISRVQDVHSRIEERRKALLMQERQARGALREEVMVGDSSRNGAITQMLDLLFKAQRERSVLNEEEQKQLSQFMTPLQRAKYFALEEGIRRLVTQMMQQASDSAAGWHPGRGRGVVPPVAMRQSRLRAWLHPGT
jgi:periplasmic protein CpxP/Spy